MELKSLSMGFSAASAVSSLFGGFYAAKAAKENLKFQAQIGEINARLSEKAAQQEIARGHQEVAQATLAAGHLKSKQRTAMAANGIDLGVGNAAEILASTEVMKEIDKNTITANAVRNAWGYRTQSTNYAIEARAKAGTAAGISPIGAGLSGFLGPAAQVASKWYSQEKGID